MGLKVEVHQHPYFAFLLLEFRKKDENSFIKNNLTFFPLFLMSFFTHYHYIALTKRIAKWRKREVTIELIVVWRNLVGFAKITPVGATHEVGENDEKAHFLKIYSNMSW